MARILIEIWDLTLIIIKLNVKLKRKDIKLGIIRNK